VGGAPRSGTTVVQNMLDCHPEILGGPEFLHIPDIIRLREQLRSSESRGWISVICSANEIDSRIRALILDFLLPFADRHGARYVSEKTPENVLVFPELVELLPGARFIHVVRDPRATVASLLAVGQRYRSKGERPAPFTADTPSAIAYVKECLNAGFRAAQAARDRVHTVVYERLIQDPEREGRDLCRFLGIDWDPAMTRPGEKKHLGEAAITVKSKEIWYDAKTYYSNPNAGSLEKWRESLTRSQQFAVCQAFRDTDALRKLGYDLALAETGPIPRLTVSLRYRADRLGHAIGRRLRGGFRALIHGSS
jgi:hypothetical protein